MSTENDNTTMWQMGSIFAGLICAGLSWYMLSPLLSSIPLIILSIFIFAVTSWGIYEAFVGYDGSSREPQTFGENAVNPTVSKMGLTDRDAWTGAASGDAKMAAAPAALAVAGAGAAAATASVAKSSKSASKPAAKKTTATATKATPAKKTSAKTKTAKPAAASKATAKAASNKAAAPKKAGPVRLKKAKGKADDLKLISGVGPKLEKTLNDLGFWHFYQIAEWKRADVAVVDDELSFKGRIDRDEWIKQAKKLAKQKA